MDIRNDGNSECSSAQLARRPMTPALAGQAEVASILTVKIS
ncbi:hypothetical protein SAMN04489724_0407 [Algoriphagus locisalis]|uniref:Uncharacterized protein n=1 Tax=Algoriphagus locisalis TaxID=305507 RepID=A0A1I6XCZ6_9BACT|nr:hypothetical protein [Algoriphagus locisalis]SFT36148.1 hypothetical protein SAMN04489724_0407 [Algoriphagus locisalis]